MGSFFFGSAQATNLEDLVTCPNPNVQNNAAQALEVGYSCKVPTVETHQPGENEGYKVSGDVRWTLVKKEGDRHIWAADTLQWGSVYVGYIEPGYHSFFEAKEIATGKKISSLMGFPFAFKWLFQSLALVCRILMIHRILNC